MLFFNRNHHTANQKEQLKTRLYDVLAHDQLYSRTEEKSAASTTKKAINKAQNNILSITPYLKRDCSNLGGFLA